MKYQLGILIVFIASSFLFAEKVYSIPAFPGAEGFGAETRGGRGGRVIKVTNLNDNGDGSLRAAVDTNGPRIILFAVSGIINLDSDLRITKPFLTIAGESSPGGILISGKRTIVNTHEVIIRHMRFRIGSHSVDDYEKHDAVQVLGKYWASNETYNIIFDHCSVSWGIDENFSISGGVTNMTVQWSIISEGLRRAGHPKGQHSKGLMISGKYELPNSISLHHNYIAHNQDRVPLIYAPGDVDVSADVVNNVIYNWKGGLGPGGGGPAKVNWVHNYAKQGPNSNDYTREVHHDDNGDAKAVLYVYGNIGSTRLSQDEPQWNVQNGWRNIALSTAWRKDTRWDFPLVTTTEMSDEYAKEILQTVGANRPFRDSVDERLTKSFSTGIGGIIDNVSYPADFPIFAQAAPPIDTDNDGMADSWEIANGLNVGADDSAVKAGNHGYTNIERYLHFLADGKNETAISPPLPPSNFYISTKSQQSP